MLQLQKVAAQHVRWDGVLSGKVHHMPQGCAAHPSVVNVPSSQHREGGLVISIVKSF